MISRVGAACAEATTITIPAGHQPGDLIFLFAFRDGSATNPTIPGGWTNITNTTDGTSCSIAMGWRIATSAAETSGTWTNASGLGVGVYRGVRMDGVTPIGTFRPSSGTAASVTYADVPLLGETSWVVSFAGHRSTNTTLETPPPGLVNVATLAGATAEYAVHDSNGQIGEFPQQTVPVGGTASGWITVTIELKAPALTLNNYLTGFRSSGGLSMSEKVR